MRTRKIKMSNIDITIIQYGLLPKSFICPHCHKRNPIPEMHQEDFIRYMKHIQHCDYCGNLHFWELRLSEFFMKNVIDYINKNLIEKGESIKDE